MIKIKSSMVVCTRVSDRLYIHLTRLAAHKGVNISDYINNALVKYSGFKEDDTTLGNMMKMYSNKK